MMSVSLRNGITNLQCVCRTSVFHGSRRGAEHDEWTGFIFSMFDYLEEMRSPLEMNKCGIYVSINI